MINSEFKKLIHNNPDVLNPGDFEIENESPAHFKEKYSNYDINFMEKTRQVNSAKKHWGPLMFKNMGITI